MSARLDTAPRRRPMVLADVAAVMAIETTAYSHPWSRGNFIDSLAAGYLAEVLEAGDGTLAGYFVALPGVDELHLLNITVAPGWQGCGHGQALLAAVRAHAEQRGLRAVWLEVRKSNLRAQALYRRSGFVDVGTRRGYYPAVGGREDAAVMSLPLGPHGLD